MYGIRSSSTNLHFSEKHLNESCTLALSKVFLKIYPLHKRRKKQLSRFYSLYCKGYRPQHLWRRPVSWLSTDSLALINAWCLRSVDLPAHHQAPTAFLPCMSSSHHMTSSCSPVNPFFRKLFLGPCFLVSLLSSGPSPVHAGWWTNY